MFVKNLLLTLSAFLVLPITTNAQTCTPDLAASGLITPSSDADIQKAQVDVNYEQTFQLKIPKDTIISVDGFGDINASVNYLIVDSITGFPTGGPSEFDYNCNPINCTYPAESVGCLVVFGTPWEALGGTTIPIKIHTRLNGTGFIGPVPITDNTPLVFDFNIEVLPKDINVSTNFINKKTELLVFPNPTSDFSNIKINSIEKGSLQINIVNLLGVRVLQQKVPNFNGSFSQQISKAKIGSGVFFVSVVINGKETVTKLIIR
jgi:hypothetical protein